MKEITLEESKCIQLSLLEKIHAFCEENGIVYYLMYGTLLGAVRHQGFIPWDDDIDIAMPRADYNRFCQTFAAEDAKVVACDLDDGYYLPFGKVIDTRTVLKEKVRTDYTLGVYVDVFVLDALSPEPAVNRRAFRKLLLLRNFLMLGSFSNMKKRHGVRRILHTLLRPLSVILNMNRISRKMNRIARKINPDGIGCEKLATLMATDASAITDLHFDRTFFDKRVLLTFEGKEFWCPADYDGLLRFRYGEYMQLPPEEERASHHECTQYWKE